MSDTDSDIMQERNMDVDKLDFLNSFFSESVPDISPECPIDLFLSPEVNQAMGNSGSDQTMSSACSNRENNPARNGVPISKFTGVPVSINGDNFGLQTPSKLKSRVNFSSGYLSSSLATPEPSSGDGQVFISTPSSNFSCPQDGVQASSKVFCPKNILPAFSLNPMNHSASSSHAEKDLDPSNIMESVRSVGCSSLDFVPNNGSDDTIRPLNPVANFTFVPSTHSISSSSYKDHPPKLVRVLPPAQLFPKSIPYLDQLDYCFDSQLSPAPGPRQVSSDDQNNNTAVDEAKAAVEATQRFLPSVKVSPSPPVAVLLQQRLAQNPQMQNLKPKKLRSLKPSLKVETQESDCYPLKTKDLPQLQSYSESANRPSNTISSDSSGDHSSRTQSIFKTDISSFYSNSARQVPHAVQLGQNTIPLAKKRKNSAEFWNVELFEDGTEDLFIEKPKRFRDRRKKKVVDEKVSKEACDIEVFEDGSEDLFNVKPNRFRDRQKKKVVDKKVSKEPSDFELFRGVAGDLLTEEPKRFRDSQRKRVIDEKVMTVPDHPGLIKVPSDKLGLLKSIRIASPIVSSKAKSEVIKSASLVKIVKLSKPKKNEEVKSIQVPKVRKFKDVCSTSRPDCAGCVELRLQHKRINYEDVENNLSDAGGLSNLCEDCGSEICLNTEGDKESSGDVDPVIFDINEETIKEISPNLNESEDDNEVGKLVMDVEEVSEIASSKDSEEEDTTKSGSTNVSAVCSSSTPPSLYQAVCWSCKSTRSLGSWHAHKWQHDKFLCSSCFNFYKEKNAESSRKKIILPRKKKKSEQSNQSGTVSKVASPSLSESLDFLTFPQYSPSLQDLPPGTYDFSAQVETELASIST